jgi:AraC family ethanolamine operon transcriptional activator
MDNNLFVPQILICDKFKDLEYINEVGQGWDNKWTYIKDGKTKVQLWFFTTPKIQYSFVRYDNAIMIDSNPPLDSVQISLIRSQSVCSFNNKTIKPNEMIVIQSGETANYLASGESEIFTLIFEKHFFNKMFQHYFGMQVEKMAIDNRLSIEEQGVDEFITQMEYWLNYFQDDESRKLTLNMFLRIEEDIVENLFSLIRLQESKDQKETFDIAKARRLLEKNIDSIYNIQDLVEELNISIRTLQYNFKGKLGISPKHYLQNLRLNAIRKELLQQNVDEVNISNIALKYGFFHPSHFTLEYKKLFGETPTQTLTKDINTPKPHTFKLLI